MEKTPLMPRAPKSFSVWVAWLAGAALSTAMLVCLWLFGDMRFANNDDMYILRAFMGFYGGVIPTFNIYLNALLCYPLNWLGNAFPGVAWFSWMQLAFLWLSSTVCVKSLVMCFKNHGRSAWLGLAAGAAFLTVYAMVYSCAVTYTVTAGLLGAAAVLQIMSIDCQRAGDGQIIRGMAFSLLLVVFAYSLRQITAVPILLFCGLAFLFVGTEYFGFGKNKKRSWRPLLLSALLVALVMGGLAGLREWEIRTAGMEDSLAWQRARIQVMDYAGLDGLPQELLEEIGWTESERQLVNDWYFMDSNITAEAFDKIYAYQSASQDHSLSAAISGSLAQLRQFPQKDPTAMRSVWLLCAVAALCAVALLLRRKGVLWRWLCLGAALLLGAAPADLSGDGGPPASARGAGGAASARGAALWLVTGGPARGARAARPARRRACGACLRLRGAYHLVCGSRR